MRISKNIISGIFHRKEMFKGCTHLKSVDTSHFTIKRASVHKGMFDGCDVLPEQYKRIKRNWLKGLFGAR